MPWSNARAYPVVEYGDLFWAYLGPTPAPPLPTHDLLERAGRRRIIVHPKIESNWTAVPERPADGGLWLRTPVDDSHTWQITVESIADAGDEAPAEVIYLDEEAGKPFRGWASNVLRG
jgi:hypothetical protein